MSKKLTYVREWKPRRPNQRSSGTLRAIIVRLDEPVEFLGLAGPDKSGFLCVIATQFHDRSRVDAYHVDERGDALSIVFLVEKWNTVSLRETMTEAGYDVSSWPKDIQ